MFPGSRSRGPALCRRRLSKISFARYATAPVETRLKTGGSRKGEEVGREKLTHRKELALRTGFAYGARLARAARTARLWLRLAPRCSTQHILCVRSARASLHTFILIAPTTPPAGSLRRGIKRRTIWRCVEHRCFTVTLTASRIPIRHAAARRVALTAPARRHPSRQLLAVRKHPANKTSSSPLQPGPIRKLAHFVRLLGQPPV
jgi:hypothetical protein